MTSEQLPAPDSAVEHLTTEDDVAHYELRPEDLPCTDYLITEDDTPVDSPLN